jgi:hypothetical protein
MPRTKAKHPRAERTLHTTHVALAVGGAVIGVGLVFALGSLQVSGDDVISVVKSLPSAPHLDKDAYNAGVLALAHINVASTTIDASTTTPKGITLLIPATATTSVSAARHRWPVATVYPGVGALLPFNRIVAYYGNFYSKAMGILGQDPPSVMIPKLLNAVHEWEVADPATPVIPAIHYIVETAQADKSKSGYYIARMPDTQIDAALALASRVNGLVFLDFQVGTSNVQRELPMYEKYLALPNVHVGIDPEFSMKGGARPGTVIGTMDATDVNWVATYLAGLVRDNHLPPKILIVHRFTEEMLTHATRIAPLPEVQVVMDMDGWGTKEKKIGTYTNIVAAEPVQFTGFKLFYKNDIKPPSTGMLSPRQVLDLTPAPIYIQYQ